MGSEQYPLRQSGIYRNLPNFDTSIKDLTAIIVGATGISGFNTLRCLLDSPQRWKTIYALSRKPPTEEMWSLMTPEQQARVQHVPIDLSKSADETSTTLEQAGVRSVDHVFFYGYIHPKGKSAMDPSMADALIETNVPIFEKFLQALEIRNIAPKRILLQTGGKHYGVHVGRARTPFIESDPRPTHVTKNFYYPQEDALLKFCEQHPTTKWNVIRPFGIIGATANSGINFFLPFAIFAAVQAANNEPIFFGGDIDEWQHQYTQSSAKLTGYLSEWAVLEETCANQAFNSQDGSAISWDRFWEELARWYGVQKGVEGPELDEAKFKSIELAGGKESPLGYGPPLAIKLSRTIVDWSKDPKNHAAWEKIMQASKGKITANPFDDAGGDLFEQGDFLYANPQPSIAKTRRFGFCGFVDTMESVFEMYQEMAQLGVIPPPLVDAARPMV
ncbi:hypothetical protein M409DRAFT_18086 [Zasmidium cellare ATCC 36951]|uniref:PRISE-like Rossmann-fold domain-containing protein n=1 Tax=Zasmidium cellare ATCC 36951 TaxID=1080233 RepID=A0A6A6CYN1_ZASCE|nr:uncharacterized protein M409DRAFT_18086 [Zasmidium cellare ATCC 36951]KAF2171853.1 hypothetical protein M409DRAFT_18086 [Zasmidium cellare ATCC 36951]